MTFRNSILAGSVLVREAIKSDQYVAGSTGWRIARNGDAEFNNLTVRGTFETGTAAQRVVVSPNGAGSFPEIDFETGQAGETLPGFVYASPMTNSPQRAELLLQSPTFSPSGPGANINLRSGASDGSIPAQTLLGALPQAYAGRFGSLPAVIGVSSGLDTTTHQLAIQSGNVVIAYTPGVNGKAIAFPSSFPTACLAVIPALGDITGGTSVISVQAALGAAAFQVIIFNGAAEAAAGNYRVHYLAIGY